MIPTDLKANHPVAPVAERTYASDQRERAVEGLETQFLLDKSVSSGGERVSWLKEAAYLKEVGASVDFEKTVEDMFGIIRSMESKLTHVLNVNALLDRDMNNSKERIAGLKMERDRLRELLARRDEEIPTARELQMVIDQLIEERNDAELRIRDLKRRNDQTGEALVQAENRIAELDSKRKDLIVEINFLESRLNAALDAAKQSEERIGVLDEQAQADKQKLKDLDTDLQLVLDDKFSAGKALREAQRTVAEVEARLAAIQRQG